MGKIARALIEGPNAQKTLSQAWTTAKALIE
jgi:hypothetical protein